MMLLVIAIFLMVGSDGIPSPHEQVRIEEAIRSIGDFDDVPIGTDQGRIAEQTLTDRWGGNGQPERKANNDESGDDLTEKHPCEDAVKTKKCEKKKAQGKCNRIFVQRRCQKTCNLCDDCASKVYPGWDSSAQNYCGGDWCSYQPYQPSARDCYQLAQREAMFQDTGDLQQVCAKFDPDCQGNISAQKCEIEDMEGNCIEQCFGSFATGVREDENGNLIEVCFCKGQQCNVDPCDECERKAKEQGAPFSCPCPHL